MPLLTAVITMHIDEFCKVWYNCEAIKEKRGLLMQENKMGVMPVKKLIISMSVPMMISMLVQALYNIVDSIFVARIGEDALTAVTIVFPLQQLMIAVGTGTGVGVNSFLSRSLGEKNIKNADRAANTALLLSFLNWLVFLVIGLTVVKPFINSQTDAASTREYGITYGTIVCCMSFGLFFQIMLERLLQSTGRTILSMASQITGAVINTILDPLLIFGLLGFPKLGIAGAAYATVIGQCCAAVLALILNITKNKELHFSIKAVIKPKLRVVSAIYSVGLPSILMISIGSVMTYSMNMILKTFSDTATAVFGSYFKLQSFVFMPIFGLNNGTIPVLAYNFGAKKKDRIDDTLRFTLKLAIAIMIIGTLVFETCPKLLLLLFDASDHMLEIGVPALRIIALHFPIAGACIVLISVFQAFAKGVYSFIISICRQLVVLIPAAYLFSLTKNVANVWWAFPIAELFALVLTLILFKRVYASVFPDEKKA